MEYGLQGYMRVQIRRPDLSIRWDSGWFPNKILDAGRNVFATENNFMDHCQVGTSSIAPLSTQTSLIGYVVGTNTVVSTTEGESGTEPYYGWKRTTFRFIQGAGHGGQNLSEAGVGWGLSGSTLTSRALIIDPQTQQPTTISPLVDEILDVTYELRYYSPTSDVTNSVTLNGVNYDTITRAANAASANWSDEIGLTIEANAPFTSSWKAYDGVLGTVTQAPNGNSSNLTATTEVSDVGYVNNSYQREMIVSCGISTWNLGSGIRSVYWQTTAGAFQTQFDSNPGGSTIPKTTNETMILRFVVSWAAINVRGDWSMIAASDSTTPTNGEWNTNVAETTLRIAWEDGDTNDQQDPLQVENGTVFKIQDLTDATKWVEYTVGGAYTEQASWTEYPVTQTAINNSGPTVGNSCDIRNYKR